MPEQKVSRIEKSHEGMEVNIERSCSISGWRKIIHVHGNQFWPENSCLRDCEVSFDWHIRDPQEPELKPSRWIINKSKELEDHGHVNPMPYAIIAYLDEQRGMGRTC